MYKFVHCLSFPPRNNPGEPGRNTLPQSRDNIYRPFAEVAVEQSPEFKLANVKNNLRNLRKSTGQHYCEEAESDKVLALPARKAGVYGILLPSKGELSALDRALLKDTRMLTP